MIEQNEQPTPDDVLAHLMAHVLTPIEGGADSFDHFLQTISTMPPGEFYGAEVMRPIGRRDDDGYREEFYWSDILHHETDDPRPMFAHQQRCFIGHAIVVAPEVYEPLNEEGEYADVAFVARVYGLPYYMVGYIYSGVAGMNFADAVDFATKVVEAERTNAPYPNVDDWNTTTTSHQVKHWLRERDEALAVPS